VGDPRRTVVQPIAGALRLFLVWQMIGRAEADPVWEDHIQYCIGYEVCEIAVRIWVVRPEKRGLALELRFHPNCVNEVIVKQGERLRTSQKKPSGKRK
jgi:hypothetical protein